MSEDNLNGSRVKIREQSTVFQHKDGDTSFVEYEIITPHAIARLGYMIKDGKVTCRK